jgi:predicted nucleotidyltransferase
VNDEEMIRALIETLAEQEDVLAAYLFGSYAARTARPDSDVDVAVLLSGIDSEARFFRRLRLIDTLSTACGREADAIVLQDAPPILQHQVLKNGQMIFERDRRARVAFEVLAGKIYADLEPQRSFFRQALLDEIREVGLGGR